jgi:carbamoyltransferase
MKIASLYPCPFDPQEAHDANASIISNGNIYAYEEEKLTTLKVESTVKFSERSLMMGCRELNVLPSEIDHWVFPTPSKPIDMRDFYQFFSYLIRAYQGSYEQFKVWFEEKVHFVDHAVSHASMAVHGSKFDNCAFLTKDGGGDLGDLTGFSFGEYKNRKISIIKRRKSSQNISSFHDYLTEAIGFSYFQNGKTSGLASYGKVLKPLLNEYKKLLKIKNDGIYFENERYKTSIVNLSKVQPSEYSRNKIFREAPSDTNIYRISDEYLIHDIAATGEYAVHSLVLELLKRLRPLTDLNKIVFSGGLFQNVALNREIFKSNIFDEVYFPMAPSDVGLSLGQALYIENKMGASRPRKDLLTAFIGPSYKKEDIIKTLKTFRLTYSKEKNICNKTAQLINKGKVVGWFQGKGEYGPRSLGNRSILADPRNISSKSRINQLLKKREWFMPYAPSIIEEHLNDWVEKPYESPYMQIAFKIKKGKEEMIPAAVHVDGSSRVHTVKKTDNKPYWNLINEFYKITGIPIILNTSFNRHGISTISTPRQAIEHLLEGCMDYLVIDDFLISLEENRKMNKENIQEFPEEYFLNVDSIKRLKDLFKHSNLNKRKKYLKNLSNLLNINMAIEEEKILIMGQIYLVNEAIEFLIMKQKESFGY